MSLPPPTASLSGPEIEEKIASARTVRGLGPAEYQLPYHSIPHLLGEQRDRTPDKPFLVYVDEESGERREFTFGEFHDRVHRLARYFADTLGLKRGERIATLAHNHDSTVIVYFAAWCAGLCVVPINVGEEADRIGFVINNARASAVFIRPEYLKLAPESECPGVRHWVLIDALTEGAEKPKGWRQLQEADALSNKPLHRDVTREDEALIVYTSGTTGAPKGVVLTQYNLLIDAKSIAEWHRIDLRQKMMCVLPIHHVNGIVVTLMTPLYAGGGVVLNRKFKSSAFWSRIAAEKVQVVSVVPTLLQFLLDGNEDLSKHDLRPFRHIICGAGPLTVDLAKQFEARFKVPVMHGYGLSETTCYSCFLPLDLRQHEHEAWLSDHGFPSIGVPIPSNEMAIHDEQGKSLPAGEKGEIVIRGHNVMKYYYGRPDANDSTFAHGWFRSGDEGFFLEDSQKRLFFFITGRLKELIIRGGVNISTYELDEILMAIPGVKAGLAVGFDNKYHGEEVGAYIVLQPGVKMTAEEIIKQCGSIHAWKRPKVVLFGDEVPVTSTGKYQRRKLVPLFSEYKDKQFK
jgi:long-chain acyl-CoA synthetase